MQSIDACRRWLLASGLCLAYMVGTVQAQTCIKPEGGPNTALSPEFSGTTTFEDGSSVKFRCDIGYEGAGGSSTITCTNGQWSTLALTCKRKNCGSPGIITNGDFNIDEGTEFGDIAVATCNQGYKLIQQGVRQCMDAGWRGHIPTCEVSKCGPPPTIVNGRPSPDKESYDYDDVIRYTCNPEFTLKGSRTIHCKGDEVFEPDAPQCLKVECPEPDVSNANVIDGGSAPYGHKSFLTYKCKAGFDMVGLDSITCEIDSEWKPPVPECRATPTTTKASPTTTIKASPPTTTKKPTEKVPGPGPGPGPEPVDPPPPPPHNIGAIVGGVLGTLAVIGLCAVGFFYKKKREKRSSPPIDSL